MGLQLKYGGLRREFVGLQLKYGGLLRTYGVSNENIGVSNETFIGGLQHYSNDDDFF